MNHRNHFRFFWQAFFFLNALFVVGGTTSVQSVFADDSAGDIQDSIDKIQKKLESATKKKAALEVNLSQVNASINATVSAMRKTQSAILDAKDSITRKALEIDLIGQEIELKQEVLSELLREAYLAGGRSPVEVALGSETLSEVFDSSSQFAQFDLKIQSILDETEALQEDAERQKGVLEDLKKEHEEELAKKAAVKADLSANQAEISQDVAKQDATISELQQKISKLKSDLSKLLGKSYDAKDIADAAAFAAKQTGVRKDFILGMLVVESDLGRYTGGCDYKESRMSSYRLTLFKKIADELDYNYKKLKVSCPPKSYSGTGGAMGVAQFMSDTWMGYKSQIASLTGHNPPDPWNLTDGVVAMATKLGRGGATKKSGECNAAKLYLSGTTSSKYNWYCERVLYWADNYEKKF